MTRAGLLRSRREGRNIFYVVDFDHARRLMAYLSDSCCAAAAAPQLSVLVPLEGGTVHG